LSFFKLSIFFFSLSLFYFFFPTINENLFADDSFLGINGIPYFHKKDNPAFWEEGKKRLEISKNLGIKYQRIDFWWDVIEPQKSKFRWDLPDRVVKEFKDANQEILPILCYSSAWSNGVAPDNDDERKEFGEYVFQVINRYKNQIKYWEVWNEPNILPYWSPRPDPKLYTLLLKEAYRKAKEADPSCNIVGVCSAGCDLDFIEDIYYLGGGNSLDSLSFHHYDSGKDEKILQREILSIHRIMSRYGDSNKKIWITEMGIPTGFDSGGRDKVSLEQQASWLAKKYLTAIETGLVEKIFWYCLVDDAKNEQEDGHWGLLFFNRSMKPSALAHKALSEKIESSVYLGNFRIGNAISSHLFEDKSGSLFGFFWNNEDNPAPFPIFNEGKIIISNLYGKERELKKMKGRVFLTSSNEPICIKKLSNLYIPYATLKVKPEEFFIFPGEKHSFELSFKNPFKSEIAGVVKISFPDTLKINPLEIPFELKKDEDFLARREVSCPQNQKTGWYEGEIKILFDGSKSDIQDWASKTFQIQVSNPFKIALLPNKNEDKIKINTYVKNVSDKPLNGELTWKLRPHGKSLAQPVIFKDLTPNRVYEDFCSLRSGSNETKIVAEVKTDKESWTSETLRICAQTIVQNDFIIDGKIGEWSPLDFLCINEKDQILKWNTVGEWTPGQHSGKVWLAWTDSNLYIAALVCDETPNLNAFKEGDIWKGDCVEIYLGLEGPTLDIRKSPSHFQIGLSPGGPQTPPQIWIWAVGKPISDGEVKSTTFPGGYTLEAKIPIKYFNNFTPSDQKIIGFDVAINNLHSLSSKQAESVLIWNGTAQNWNDPSKWGTAILFSSRKYP